MDKANIKKEIEELKKFLNIQQNYYYSQEKPIIADEDYDKEYNRLEKLERKYPEYITPDSPTQNVGGAIAKGFRTVKHKPPFSSINFVKNYDDLDAFDKKIKRELKKDNIEYVCELKIDGLAISLQYKKGKFALGLTRGDKQQGEDVTRNIKTIKSIPFNINKTIDLEVRGEVYLPYEALEQINNAREKAGETIFANARNAASGSVRQLDPKITESRPLDIFIYLGIFGKSLFKTHYETLIYLKDLGFDINPNIKLCKNISEVKEYISYWEGARKHLNYDTDGIVIKVNNLNDQRKLGSTARSYKWAIAYKYPPMQKDTILEDIKVQVGRTGAITPVAHLKPVHLAGVIIKRATLHNEDEIKRKGLKIGDHVVIQRAGEVIPEVVEFIKEKRTGQENEFKMPKKCPVCGGELYRPEGEAITRCINAACPAQAVGRLIHFCSRQAMDIEHVGPALAEQLYENKLVKDVADLYDLKLSDVKGLERFAEKSAQNVIYSIQGSKEQTPDRLLFALGIRLVGRHIAALIAQHYDDLEELFDVKAEQLTKIAGIGPKVAASLEHFFSRQGNKQLIERLKRAGVRGRGQRVKGPQPLKGKTFVFTGGLEKLTRPEAEELVRQLGGHPASSVSKQTDYVVAGTDPGSKYDQAKKLGVKIVSEDEFLKLVG